MSGKQIVILCTDVIAFRDYVPGITEAYYRHLPAIAVTSHNHLSTYHPYKQIIMPAEVYDKQYAVFEGYRMPIPAGYDLC